MLPCLQNTSHITHHVSSEGTVMHGSTSARPLWAIPHFRITLHTWPPPPPSSPPEMPRSLSTVLFLPHTSQRR